MYGSVTRYGPRDQLPAEGVNRCMLFDDAIDDSKRGLEDLCLRASLEWLLSVRDT